MKLSGGNRETDRGHNTGLKIVERLLNAADGRRIAFCLEPVRHVENQPADTPLTSETPGARVTRLINRPRLRNINTSEINIYTGAGVS